MLNVRHSISPYRITVLVSRIQFGKRAIFLNISFSVVDQLFQEKNLDFFLKKFIWVGEG